MHPGHPIVTPYLRISTSRLIYTRLALGPQVLPCSGGTSGALKRILAAGSARRRSQGSPLTASSNSMSQAPLKHHLDCSAQLHPIWCPNGIVTRANPTAEDSHKDAFLPSALSTDAVHVLLGTHPPNLLSPWSYWSAKLAPDKQLIRRLPVELWPKPIDRGRCMRYRPCQAVMSLRDSPPKTHLCAVPQGTNLRLELFDCPSASPCPGLCSLLPARALIRAGRLTPRAAFACANNAGSPSLRTPWVASSLQLLCQHGTIPLVVLSCLTKMTK